MKLEETFAAEQERQARLDEEEEELRLEEEERDRKQELLEGERQKLKDSLKAVHIKRSRREYVQLYKNFFLFYDKKLESKLAPDQTIIDLAVHKFEKECFTGHR